MKRYAIWPLAALVLLALPFVFDSGTSLTKMSLMCIMAVFALSYNMLLGQTGMLSFGHAVYYGLAGFMSIHALQILAGPSASMPLIVVPIVGAVTGLLFALIFGWVSTKRAGTAFAMISLGLGELVAASSLIMRSFFGGEEGVSADRSKLAAWLGLDFGAQIQVYYLIAAWTFFCGPSDVCDHPNAIRTDGQRCSRESRARGVYWVLDPNDSLYLLLSFRHFRWDRGRTCSDQF